MSTEHVGTDQANLAADVVLFATDHMPGRLALMFLTRLYVLVIQRGWDPHEGCWALPGGLVDREETFEQAARRELGEETGVVAPVRLDQVGVYDNPERDPRGRVVSVAFVGLVHPTTTAQAGDDARAARWVLVNDVLDGTLPVAFDHHQIIDDAVSHLRTHGWWGI